MSGTHNAIDVITETAQAVVARRAEQSTDARPAGSQLGRAAGMVVIDVKHRALSGQPATDGAPAALLGQKRVVTLDTQPVLGQLLAVPAGGGIEGSLSGVHRVAISLATLALERGSAFRTVAVTGSFRPFPAPGAQVVFPARKDHGQALGSRGRVVRHATPASAMRFAAAGLGTCAIQLWSSHMYHSTHEGVTAAWIEALDRRPATPTEEV